MQLALWFGMPARCTSAANECDHAAKYETPPAPRPTWLVKEQDITKDGWPVAQPRLSRRPSASTITPWPSGKMKRSTWGLMFWLQVQTCD